MNETNDVVKQFLLQLSMIPGLGDGVRGFIDLLLGKAPYGLNWLSINTKKSLGWNVESAQRSAFIRGSLYDQHTKVTDLALRNALTNLYTISGYRGKALEQAVESAATGPIAGFVSTMLAPQVADAYGDIGAASYRRIVARTSIANYKTAVGDFYREILKDAISGRMGGLTIGETGKIAAQLINTGAFESAGLEDGAFNTRINRVRKELTSYAQSVGVLKDVINGPVEDILKTFEALTGNKLTTMAAGRVEMLTNSMQSALFVAGVTPQQLATQTARQYGLIAPYGGTLAQANAMATASTTAIASGVRIEGLSDIQLGEALARDNAGKLLSGDLRRRAAAYQHWRLKYKREDNAFSFEEFRRFLGTRSAEDYLRTEGKDLDASFYASRLVTNTMANPEFLTQARASQFTEYQKALDRLDLSAYSKNGDVQKSIRRIIKNEFDPSRMLDSLVLEAGLSENAATRLVASVQAQAMSSFQSANELEAMGMAGTAANADRIQRMKLGGIALQRLRGMGLKGGGAGLLNYMLTDPDKISPGIASLLATWLAGNPADAAMAESEIAGILRDRDANGQLTKKAKDALQARLNGLGQENIDALLGAGKYGEQWTKNGVLATAASAMVKEKNKLYKATDPIEKKMEAVAAARNALLTAIRTGKNKNGERLTMAELKRLAEPFEFTESDLYSQLLASKLGGGQIEETDITKLKRLTKDAEAELQAQFLDQHGASSVKDLKTKEQQAAYTALTDKAVEIAALRFQGQQTVDLLRLKDPSKGRMSVEDTVAAIMASRNKERKQGAPLTLEQQSWDTAAEIYKLRTGKDLATADEAVIKKHLEESIVRRGGMEDLLQQLLDGLAKLIPALNNLAKNITGQGGTPSGGR